MMESSLTAEEVPPVPVPSTSVSVSADNAHSRESSEFEFVERNKPNKNIPSPSALPSFVVNQETPTITTTTTTTSTSSTSSSSSSSSSSASLFGWVKGAGGGLLAKVAEKTKSSVESVITTLDPQMKEYIYSGGDVQLVVASDKEAKVNPIREGFQKVFGHATVFGLPSKASNIAEQPVGFAAGRQGATERIQSLRSKGDTKQDVIVALENFLLEVGEDSWVDLGCLSLSDPVRDVYITMYTQPTNVDVRYVDLAKEQTPADYPKRWSGFKVPIGGIIADQLGVLPSQWHEAVSGGTTTRKDIVYLAAVTLAGMYKKALLQKVETI